MAGVKMVYDYFCKFEVMVTSTLVVALTTLVFVSAIGRTFGHPLNWAVDIALLIFAWLVFLSADVAVRTTNLVSVDLLYRKFPPAIRKFLSMIFIIIIVAFLGVLTYYGTILTLDSTARLFQTLNLSYAWCTLAVPTGSALMIISFCIKFCRIVKTPIVEWEG